MALLSSVRTPNVTSSHARILCAEHKVVLLAVSLPIVTALIPRILRLIRRLPPIIYDTFLVNMTEVWYTAVFSRIGEGEKVLDIGVGTGGAIIRTRELILSRDIFLVGIDISACYVDQAKKAMKEHNLTKQVEIRKLSVNDAEGMQLLAEAFKSNDSALFDSAYFSGSLSLMEDPVKALKNVARVVRPGGKIYVTQTFQEESTINYFLSYAKPAFKYITTVDFGQLVTNNQILSLYASSGLKLIEHGILPGSVGNMFQSAYLSILEVP